ncbi:MAG: acyltransferase [Nocardioides sp.]
MLGPSVAAPKHRRGPGAAAVAHTYRPDLDGLRSIAVYLVLLFHTGLSWATGGFIGVDLFFVLSGFLVTTVLVDEIEQTGRLRVGQFYARRVRRLLPAALITIVATASTFAVLWPVVRRLEIVGDAQSSLLYYANWHFISASGDYFAAETDKSPFLHFWSLAIEEQYYVVFPVLLLVLSRFGRPVLQRVLMAGRCSPSRRSCGGRTPTPPTPTTAPRRASTSCWLAPAWPSRCARGWGAAYPPGSPCSGWSD